MDCLQKKGVVTIKSQYIQLKLVIYIYISIMYIILISF